MSSLAPQPIRPETPPGAGACVSAGDGARRVRVSGRVQGVGFRPYVHGLASALGLAGWVRNRGGEVEIHLEGPQVRLEEFAAQLLRGLPGAARAHLVDARGVLPEAALRASAPRFCIRPSVDVGGGRRHVPSDVALCAACLEEMRDPAARRFRYPFTGCAQCGPRYTLVRALPFDRVNTGMDAFAPCARCRAEFDDPRDRRHHAQVLVCADCGPALLWHGAGQELRGSEVALHAALATLRGGGIVALRGVGGYHLVCDAADDLAVARLRARKDRPAKPLAVMVPWRGCDGLDAVRALAPVRPDAAVALCGPERPIVLVEPYPRALLATAVAPGLREVGLMLPCSPLQHLLLEGYGAALVATSGNVSGEPVITDPAEAQMRLAQVADGFLHHDFPILRPVDDSVLRSIGGALRPLRIGRGMAPLELALPQPLAMPTLAVGAHGKNTVALAWDDRVVVSPHLGDLSTPRAYAVFERTIEHLQALYGVRAQCIAHDAHPDFPSTRWARATGLPTQSVWHHTAHAAAVAGEYPGAEEILCFTWDGMGLGSDGRLAGGEALLGRPGAWTRAASWRRFRLPGGERAARQPWRSALALCWEGGFSWEAGERDVDPLLRRAFERGVNAPATSAVGRLFDAATAYLGLCRQTSYEGEAAQRLEALCDAAVAAPEEIELPLARDALGLWCTDWAPLVPALLDVRLAPAERALGFHASLARALCAQACAVRAVSGVMRIGLAGGVFQNRVLTNLVQSRLTAAGFEVLIPRLLPLNDAAISYGQMIEMAARQGLRGGATTAVRAEETDHGPQSALR
jgi:hydrogenase maturation protein HypF